MKNKFLVLFLVLSIVLSFAACGKASDVDSKESQKTSEDSNSGETLKAEKNILSVEVTLPASLIGDDSTDLDDEARAAGVKEITKNEDGSVTMKMTKEAHLNLLNSIKESVDESNAEILSDKENYPSFDSIVYNDDLTEFTVKVDASLYNSLDSFVALAFYMEGGIYQALNAVPEDQINIIVNFINKDTDEVIESVDSSSMSES